ncbi:caspase family protein, partial [bacterium]|nr:caspase family protein [bacterium]
NIFVNDVPIFGAYGKPISGHQVALNEQVELTSGKNKIEISCLNEKGAESYRALTNANYDQMVEKDLYFIGFGVSKYKNSELNLKFAHKDAKDIATTLSKIKKQFHKVRVKTFLDDQVTLDAIKNAKSFLADAKVDDTFILFIAGHGVHDTDKEATYYYLTHEADVENLSQTAANFDLVEDLLQGIAPRNKLFLMDTCESGEVEDTIQEQYFSMANTRGIKARTTRAIKLSLKKKESKSVETSVCANEQGQRGIKLTGKSQSAEAPKADQTACATPRKWDRSFLIQKDRYVYNDLIRRSGTIVFSSSKGGEFSYESEKIENGYFTEEIIKALTGKQADTDNDGMVNTDELRKFVSTEVPKYTQNQQHPTVDRDNIFLKFALPLVQ